MLRLHSGLQQIKRRTADQEQYDGVGRRDLQFGPFAHQGAVEIPQAGSHMAGLGQTSDVEQSDQAQQIQLWTDQADQSWCEGQHVQQRQW